jgi:hypothetical protein
MVRMVAARLPALADTWLEWQCALLVNSRSSPTKGSATRATACTSRDRLRLATAVTGELQRFANTAVTWWRRPWVPHGH